MFTPDRSESAPIPNCWSVPIAVNHSCICSGYRFYHTLLQHAESWIAEARSYVKVQFLSFEGCPLAEAARACLEKALADCGIEGYETIDIFSPDVPDDLRAWGSPTILINGRDVTDQQQGDGIGCRVYSTPSRVPGAELIASRLAAALVNGRA